MTYTEDDLTEGLIEQYQDRDLVYVIEPEAHYDHYGYRGWPDLYAVFERPVEGLIEYHLTEVKSEPAVKAATGANEIIRQFNQMRRYFFEDDRNHVHLPDFEYKEVVLVFQLAFIPTEYTILHLFDNKEMYNEAINSSSMDPYDKLPPDQSNRGVHRGIEVSLELRHPAAPSWPFALVLNREGSRFEPEMDPLDFLDHVIATINTNAGTSITV